MLMKKFLGATAREAMQRMKAELGPEALVISNRKTGDGVEILAMAEGAAPPAGSAPPEPQPLLPAARAGAASRAAVRPAVPEARQPGPAARFTSLKDFAPRVEAQAPRAAPFAPASPAPQRPRQEVDWHAMDAYAAQGAGRAEFGFHSEPPRPPAAHDHFSSGRADAGAAAFASAVPAAPVAGPLAAAASQHERRMFEELSAMKAMLQDQISGQAWRDMAERRPLAVKVWRELVEAGFSPSLARAVADKLPDDHNQAQARKWLAEVLARNIRCVNPAIDMVESGGVFALVGPTGVGKTTTTAKLAARCVVKYGAQSLGMITTDSYRIGAFDQLAIYGKILGVPVHSAQSYGELEATIATMAAKRLVLIDTTGMGQRDNRVAEQINLLNNPRIKRVLLLNCAAQAETLEDVARAYQGKAAGARPLAGAILTKIDEAAKLAPVLDVVARHGLELQHVTNGQRVPEDIHTPTSAALVHRALKAALDPVFALRDNELAARAMLAPPAAGQVAGRFGA